MMLTAALACALSGATSASAAAPPHLCAATITACGCVITKAGTYTVGNDLSATQTTRPKAPEGGASDPPVVALPVQLQGDRLHAA